MASAEYALPPGYGLHEYRIESTLGVGGFGLTYLATDANLNLKVAIKEYLPAEVASRTGDQSVRPLSEGHADTFKWGLSRFLDESRTLASFRHPSIVRVMRFFETNQTAYMVMEFVSGQPLSDWARPRRPIDEAAIRAILLPLLDGLGVVHGAGFLHRDIKPANIFIREDGSPVLLDFGSARTQGGGELTAIVTPGYAPLEQYHTHGRQGPWTDLYSLGGVLYWLVTGTKPLEAAARVREDPMPPALQAGDPGRYGEPLLRAIDWMLSPSEAERPQSVAGLRSAFLGESPAAAPAVAARPVSPAQPQPVSSPLSTPTGVVFERAALSAIETALAGLIGPIAPVVLRNAARKAHSLPQLVETVAAEIEDEDARAKFIKRHAASEMSAPVSQPVAPSPPNRSGASAALEPRFDEAVLSRAERALARYLGPLARVVVRRAATKARDEAELYLLIADEIEDRSERKAFVRKAIASKA
ncbi:MAG: serine/threonine protein kinase [Burkholderiales bacterium]|nr:serine/threonine protein kinase [Burkholderiales bacterium]